MVVCFYQYKQADACLVDLDFIYETILENHPGIYNEEDPKFCKVLRENYLIAKNKLKYKVYLLSKESIIDEFVKAFSDSHLGISWEKQNQQEKLKKTNTKKRIPSIFYTNDEYLWIKIPSFQLNAQELIEFKSFLKDFESRSKTKKLLIFDLRGNVGGNSLNGRCILSAVFGDQYLEEKIKNANQATFVDWRASQGNLIFLREKYKETKIDEFQKIIEGMEKALSHGKRYYREFEDRPKPGSKRMLSSNPNIKIVVIIDQKVFSAALDFIDDLKIVHSDVTLIGQTTGKDRLYMDVRSLALPSEKGWFYFPIKVYRNRARKDNQPYIPDVKLSTENDIELKKFVEQKIL